MHQSTTPFLSQTIWPRWASRQFLSLSIVQTLLPVTFGYSLSSEAVVMRQLRRWKRLWQRSLTRSHKRTSMGPCRSCWNGTTSALQPEEITWKGTRDSCVLSIKVPIQKKSGNLSYAPRIWLPTKSNYDVGVWYFQSFCCWFGSTYFGLGESSLVGVIRMCFPLAFDSGFIFGIGGWIGDLSDIYLSWYLF